MVPVPTPSGGPPDRRRRILVAALGALLLAASVFVPGAARAAALDLTGFTLTFEERFKTLDISAHGPGTRWTAHTPWAGDFGDAVFDDPGPDGPFSISPAGLTITAHQDAEGHWHGGLICSVDKDGPGQQGFSQQYGYFEMRAKLPDGPGVWPAFWLIGINKQTSSSEIDVLEFFGAFPSYFHNWMHVFRDGKDVLLKDNMVRVPAGLLTLGFNDYGVLIGPERTRFFLNKQEIWDQPTPVEYRQPFYILANLALGGGWPIDKLRSPAAMQIEHIVVYQETSRLSDSPTAMATLPPSPAP